MGQRGRGGVASRAAFAAGLPPHCAESVQAGPANTAREITGAYGQLSIARWLLMRMPSIAIALSPGAVRADRDCAERRANGGEPAQTVRGVSADERLPRPRSPRCPR